MTACSRILLTGGGTAGHVNPALAIGRALGDERTAYLYVGVGGRAEADVVPREGMPIVFVRASPYPGARPSAAWVSFLFNTVVGTAKAAWAIRRFRPEIIVGTGGFASAPAMFAAALLRRAGLCRAQVFVHEQNAAPGKLNLLVGRLADRVFVSFPETVAAFGGTAVMAGYPLRRRIALVDRDTARASLDFAVPPGRQVVFAFGGSQGARTINRAVVDALGDLLPHRERLFVIHGTGLRRGDGTYDAHQEVQDRLRQRYSAEERQAIDTFYVARPYFHDIERIYALADLVVVRAGAGTLNEVAALGLPAVVVPKINLPGEHQVMNARALARRGGAVVLYEQTRHEQGRRVEALDGATLASTILSLTGDPGRLREMGAANRGFIDRDAIEIIRRAIAGETIDAGASDASASDVVPAGAASGYGSPLLGHGELLATLERARAAQGRAYAVDAAIPSVDDRAFYVSRAASLLASASWDARNLGVKLVGLLQARERLPLVLALLADRTPAAWYKRMLGGDFEQVGFIRRNAITTVARLGVVTPEVEQALAAALEDPYYEARAEACRAVTRLDRDLSSGARARLVSGIIRLLRDRWVEVIAAAAEALGHVGGSDDARPALVALRNQKFWMVRAAGLRGLLALVERGQAGDLDTLARDVRAFTLTATDFRPEFTIRTSYGRVVDAIESKRRTP
jgi:UDP-N-acetylglucosamine--N-acetylmuramyl-(pentapeptide) pyrophosphoryl-undecaprenol N-acetylglucosamine transferase